jgi:hypothetical protein
VDSEKIAEILRDCLQRGFCLPLHMCLIGVNGAVLAVRYSVVQTQGEDANMEVEVLAEHYTEDQGFQYPINMMITDTRGEAALVIIELPERWRFLNMD